MHRILIAEDDSHIALALKVVLQRAITPTVVTTARDGREALKQLEQDQFDLLISDWNMPYVTGEELLIQVRADPRTQQLPFLMLTGRCDGEYDANIPSDGITSCINKPFDNEALIEKVIELLDPRVY